MCCPARPGWAAGRVQSRIGVRLGLGMPSSRILSEGRFMQTPSPLTAVPGDRERRRLGRSFLRIDLGFAGAYSQMYLPEGGSIGAGRGSVWIRILRIGGFLGLEGEAPGEGRRHMTETRQSQSLRPFDRRRRARPRTGSTFSRRGLGMGSRLRGNDDSVASGVRRSSVSAGPGMGFRPRFLGGGLHGSDDCVVLVVGPAAVCLRAAV